MRRALDRLARLSRTFARDAGAVAAVEFALILPLLLLLFLGTIEGSSLLTVDRRVQIVSGTIGDLVARWDPGAGPIPASTLTDFVDAADIIVYPYSTAALRQVVSLVQVAADGTTSVIWSCGYNGGEARAAGDPYDLQTEMRTLVGNASGFVVASETWYAYTPVLGIVFDELYNLHAESFYLPRYEERIDATC